MTCQAAVEQPGRRLNQPMAASKLPSNSRPAKVGRTPAPIISLKHECPDACRELCSQPVSETCPLTHMERFPNDFLQCKIIIFAHDNRFRWFNPFSADPRRTALPISVPLQKATSVPPLVRFTGFGIAERSGPLHLVDQSRWNPSLLWRIHLVPLHMAALGLVVVMDQRVRELGVLMVSHFARAAGTSEPRRFRASGNYRNANIPATGTGDFHHPFLSSS